MRTSRPHPNYPDGSEPARPFGTSVNRTRAPRALMTALNRRPDESDRPLSERAHTMKVCIVGASGKLGQYMVQHALDRGYEVVGVCREQSVEKLDAFKGRITVFRERPTTARSSSAPSRGATGCSSCSSPRGARVLDGNGPGGARLRASGGAPGVLVRVAHHPRRPGRVLVEAQGAREGLRPARAPRSLRRPRRPGRGMPPGVRQRHALDGRARERPRGGREPGPARVEPARGRPDPREQPHAPRRLRAVHGRRPSRTTSSSTRPRRSSAARLPRRSPTPPADPLLGERAHANCP